VSSPASKPNKSLDTANALLKRKTMREPNIGGSPAMKLNISKINSSNQKRKTHGFNFQDSLTEDD
jgi:hypothetical protein